MLVVGIDREESGFHHWSSWFLIEPCCLLDWGSLACAWYVGLSPFWYHLPLPYISPSESGPYSHWSIFLKQLHQIWGGVGGGILSSLSISICLSVSVSLSPPPQPPYLHSNFWDQLKIWGASIASTVFACLGRQSLMKTFLLPGQDDQYKVILNWLTQRIVLKQYLFHMTHA